MSRPRILIIEDDERIASSIQRALSYEGYSVDITHDGLDALKAVAAIKPHLIVLDLMLPGIDGIEVCRRVRNAGNDAAVLMLTARTEVPDRVDGLDAGADDYLTKPFAYEELLARVRTLLRRRPPDDREVLRFADLSMDVDAMEVVRNETRIEFTALEFQLLEYFMRNPNVVLSRSRVLIAVWGLDTDTTSNIVDVYVRYLRQKMGDPMLIQTVRGAGYVLRES